MTPLRVITVTENKQGTTNVGHFHCSSREISEGLPFYSPLNTFEQHSHLDQTCIWVLFLEVSHLAPNRRTQACFPPVRSSGDLHELTALPLCFALPELLLTHETADSMQGTPALPNT